MAIISLFSVEMTNQSESASIGVGLRLGTMLLDHFFMTVIAMVFFIPGFISNIYGAFNSSSGGPTPDFLDGFYGYVAAFGFALYFCKDIFNGRSIAKRILGLQVVNNSTGKVASPIRCFVRNITCVLWPIEGIVAIVNTSRRLGDRLAGTRLVKFDPSVKQPRMSLVSLLIPICISYGIMLIFIQGFPGLSGHNKKYVETSYNPSESAALKKMLTDSLGQYLAPDTVIVYDSVKNANLKDIFIILKLRSNYLDDDKSYANLKAQTLDLIYTQYPEQTFVGHLEYFYRSPGQIVSRGIDIGTSLKPKEKKVID
jgi:uncharacterized RDD family membrane protein YckC